MMCKLFPFSLSDKAKKWFKSLQPSSITTWSQCGANFFNHFYTKFKTALLRNKITTFQQGERERFHEGWTRFKEYLRDCPHHGFSDTNLMNIFYNGVEWQYQMALGTTSRGDFSTNTAAEANTLINNLAASNSNHYPEYDRVHHVKSVASQTFEELNTKVDQLLRNEQSREYQAHCDMSSPQENKLELMMQQLLDSQNKRAHDIKEKMEHMYIELNGKIENLASRVDYLYMRVSQIAYFSKAKEFLQCHHDPE